MIFRSLRRRFALALCPDLDRGPFRTSREISIDWPSKYRPDWWRDHDVRTYILFALGDTSPAACVRIGTKRFGTRFPSKSALYRFWNLATDDVELQQDPTREVYPAAPYPIPRSNAATR